MRLFTLYCYEVIIDLAFGIINYMYHLTEKNGFKKDLSALPPHNFFYVYLSISNHTLFLVQIGINFQSVKQPVQIQLFKRSLMQINSKLKAKPYDYNLF